MDLSPSRGWYSHSSLQLLPEAAPPWAQVPLGPGRCRVQALLARGRKVAGVTLSPNEQVLNPVDTWALPSVQLWTHRATPVLLPSASRGCEHGINQALLS